MTVARHVERDPMIAVLDTIADEIARAMPTRDQIATEIGDGVQAQMPSATAIIDTFDLAIRDSMPSPESILQAIERAVLSATTEHLRRLPPTFD